MKIYTRRGDLGDTDLLNKRVSKSDLVINVNGAFDEAMAFLIMSKHYIRLTEIKDLIDTIHQHLFNICYEIALNNSEKFITQKEDVLWLEEKLDYYDSFLKPLNKFIKLDQTKAASWLNLARVTIRRSERELILLSKEQILTLARYFDEVE